MKKLRNLYFILGFFAIVFALLTRHIPGVTATDFIRGFCYGLASALLLAAAVTATIPYFYRNDKHGKKGTHAHAEEHAAVDAKTGETKIGEAKTAETKEDSPVVHDPKGPGAPHDPAI